MVGGGEGEEEVHWWGCWGVGGTKCKEHKRNSHKEKNTKKFKVEKKLNQ